MGGAVSSGESNDDLIDNLREADYIKSPLVEEVFRAVDRAFYYTRSHRKNAYKDVAWKDNNLHLSAPCIYSEVMENLQLKDGMSFLNIGSGTGYLSTMAGLILGRNGINHGIEVHSEVVDYAKSRLNAFLSSASAVDLYDFCEPHFVVGNCMDITKSTPNRYDRIYCGAACPEGDLQVIIDLLKLGGICIIPVNDSLMLIQRTSESDVEKKVLLPVSFATLITAPEGSEMKRTNVELPEWSPSSLSEICRSEIRQILRKTLLSVPKKSDDSGTKKRKKKTHDRRRANRLLVVQRRRSSSRSAEERENRFVAIAYSMGENSSEEESTQIQQQDQEVATTSVSVWKLPESSTASVTAEKVGEMNSEDSGTESGCPGNDTRLARNENASPENNLLEPDIVMEASASSDVGTEKSTVKIDPVNIKPETSATVVENKFAVNGTDVENGSAAGRCSSTSTTRTRTPTTESILNRIREIIHTRQLEREASRANAVEHELRLRERVEEALREPTEDEMFQDAVNDEDDEVETECVWSSADDSSTTSSSSSSSSDDDSDAYQYAEPIIIGRRRRRVNSDGLGTALPLSNGVGVAVSCPHSRQLWARNIEHSDGSRSHGAVKEETEDGTAAGEETVVFDPASVEMALKIKQLPLPRPLQKFLNYQRDL